ncbi:MAG: hypothetical protein KA100_05110 [Rickettsiales bacterium]|nr:hypothetical protein [Rickettsiales bacterium]
MEKEGATNEAATPNGKSAKSSSPSTSVSRGLGDEARRDLQRMVRCQQLVALGVEFPALTELVLRERQKADSISR